MRNRNKRDLTTWRREERSGRRLKKKRERLKLLRIRNFRNWTISKSLTNIRLNSPRKRLS